jgi:hypothetical protein
VKTAIFVGGAFDMTKRVVDYTPNTMRFYEPMDRDFLAISNGRGEDHVLCRTIEYRLMYETRHGTAIYEYSKVVTREE